MSDHGPVYERRVARLRERAVFLRKRAKERGGRDAAARSVAEATAIEWALAELEKLREILRCVEWYCAFSNSSPSCPLCGAQQYIGHREGCRLAAVVGSLPTRRR